MSSHADLVARYRRYREIGVRINSALTARLPFDVMNQGGRELGFLRKGTFVFDSEDEPSVLMDYCLYNVLRDGRNLIQKRLAEQPPPEGSDELLVLQAMAKAWYSVFGIVSVERGVGVRVVDIFRQSQHLIVDNGLSRSAVPGFLLATRVFPMDGFIMTSGAGLPLSGSNDKRDKLILAVKKTVFATNIASFDNLTPQQEQALARAIITTALSWGASSQIRYQGPDEQPGFFRRLFSRGPRPVPVPASGGRIGRNDPCPCGSAKKFKKCCGRV